MNITAIKNKLHAILPTPLFKLVVFVHSKTLGFFINKRNRNIIKNFEEVFIKAHGLNVIEGPFAPMKYTTQAVGSSFLNKLAGYYESCLHPFIEEVKKGDIRHILDIGAAEGYYTTGFGKMFPSASIAAFEIDSQGQALVREMYRINQLTSTLEVFGEATKENIANQIKPDTLLVCDCEGGEKTILDIVDKQLYKNISYGIIELHDAFVPGCKEACISYFENTHDIEVLVFKYADLQKFTFLKSIVDESIRKTLLLERSLQQQEWLLLRRKLN